MKDENELIFKVEFTKSYEIRSKNQEQEIRSITMRMPTVEDYVKALSIVGDKNEMKLQFMAWSFAIVEVDGQEVEDEWKRYIAPKLFEVMDENEDFEKSPTPND